MSMFKAFWKKRTQPVTRIGRNQLPRVLQAGIDKMVGDAIIGAQEEIIEEQVAAYRKLLQSRIKGKLDIHVTSALAFALDMGEEQFNIVVNMRERIGHETP